MKLVVLSAAAIVVWAAFITINGTLQSAGTTGVVASTVLVLAVAIQRVNGVQRWLQAPKNDRIERARTIVEETLIDLCMKRRVTDDLLGLCIHVWEIPLWYRKILPYQVRSSLKDMIKKRPFAGLAKFTIRPQLQRVVVVSLTSPPAPSRVKFRKGVGIVGVCVMNNDRSEFVTLDISRNEYQAALRDDAMWATSPASITQNLRWEDARKLANSYGQVIAHVVQDVRSGEAIGCATISFSGASSQLFDLTTALNCRRRLNVLVAGLSTIMTGQ